METVYECCIKGKDIGETPVIVRYESTEENAIKWLEDNGGGIYRNTLHNFKFYVPSIIKDGYEK